VKERKPLNPVVLIVLVIVGVLVVGGLGYFVLVRPQGAKLKHVKGDEKSAQAQLDAYHQKVLAMPAQTDMPDLVLELSQLARDTGIRFDSISPQPAVPMGSYTVLPISVTFNGTFYDLADLLYRLRSLVNVHAGRLDATGRLLSVDTLAFGESPLKFPRIQATLVIDAYSYGAAPADSSPTPLTPTTPTSTATTGTTTTGTTTTTTTTTSGTSASAAGAP
jgi:type IV pilus assembly protein PilO